MIATRPGLARLIDWQSILETLLLGQYRALRPGPGQTVLDIGAGIGDYSIWATKHGARAVAYECDRFCYPALRRNASRYGFAVVEMRVTSLLTLPEADLIKVDIEGGEFALKGWSRYPRVILEYHQPYGDGGALEWQFRDWGYAVLRRPNRHRADIGILAAWRCDGSAVM